MPKRATEDDKKHGDKLESLVDRSASGSAAEKEDDEDDETELEDGADDEDDEDDDDNDGVELSDGDEPE